MYQTKKDMYLDMSHADENVLNEKFKNMDLVLR